MRTAYNDLERISTEIGATNSRLATVLKVGLLFIRIFLILKKEKPSP